MKLLLVFSAVLVVALAGQHGNPGLKFRLTQKAFDELIRTIDGIVETQMANPNEWFKKDKVNKKLSGSNDVIQGGMKVTSLEWKRIDKGDGRKIQLEGPNVVKFVHNGAGGELQVKGINNGKMVCPQVEMGATWVNMELDKYDCNVRFPGKLSEFRFSMCLTEGPKVTTAESIDLSFCGGTSHESEGKNWMADYKPSPLVMSDAGTSKMFYMWESEVVVNTFLRSVFDQGLMVMDIDKESQPEIVKKIKAGLKEFGHIENDDAELRTVIKAAEAPVLFYEASSPSSVKGQFKVRVVHNIKECDSCEEKPVVTGLMDIVARTTFEIGQPAEGKIFPKITSKLTIESLRVIESEPAIPEGRRSKIEPKIKKGIEKMLNEVINNMNDAYYKEQDKVMPPPLRVLRVEDLGLTILDKTAEMSASVKFDVEKLVKLSKEKLGDE